jgi:hypothetical protein
MKFDIDLGLLKKTKEIRRCVCDKEIACPCDKFIDEHFCKCKVFTKVE